MNQNSQHSRIPVAARLDRLPISSYHRYIIGVLAFAFFFELGDINTISYTAPAILKQWHLTMSGIGNVLSMTFLGMFLGSSIIGWLADRIGRKRSLIITIFLYSGFSLLNAFAVNMASLLITRFVTGFGLAAMTVVAITYISETFPAVSRGKFQGWIMTVGLAGIPITAFVSRYFIPLAPWGWRLVYIWGALGLIAGLLALRLKESPRWFEDHGRLAEADEVIGQIEDSVKRENKVLPPVEKYEGTQTVHAGYKILFSSQYIGRTITLLIVWIAQTLGFYGFMSWVPTLLLKHGFSLVSSLAWSSAMAIGAVPGAFIAALISDRFERKWSISIVAVIISICGLLYGLTFSEVGIIIFGFLVAMFIQSFAPLLYAYTPELYPTEVRNSGVGLTYGIGRLANVAGPLIVVYFYNNLGYLSVFAYIAACWLICALVVGLFGPKTRARSLEKINSGLSLKM